MLRQEPKRYVSHTHPFRYHKNIIIFNERSDSSVQLVIYDDNQEDAFLYSLYVAEVNRRLGNANYLMVFAEKKAREFGCQSISLRVHKTSPQWLKDFYESFGYEDTREDKEYCYLTKKI